MSGYTSGNHAPTKMKEEMVRKGNVDHKHPSHKGGVTDVTRPQGATHYEKGHQRPPHVSGHGGKEEGVTAGRKQKVTVSMPHHEYNTKTTNDGYIHKDGKSWLK
jgi:hypothetical protein